MLLIYNMKFMIISEQNIYLKSNLYSANGYYFINVAKSGTELKWDCFFCDI